MFYSTVLCKSNVNEFHQISLFVLTKFRWDFAENLKTSNVCQNKNSQKFNVWKWNFGEAKFRESKISQSLGRNQNENSTKKNLKQRLLTNLLSVSGDLVTLGLFSICYDRCDHRDYCRESWAILTTASFQMIATRSLHDFQMMATRTKPNSDTYYLFLSKHLWQFNVNQMHKILILIPFQDYQFYTCKILLTLCLGFNYYDTILSVQWFVFYSLALRGVLVDREFQRQNLWKGLEREWHRKLEDM